tara:strand:- start:1075 stop:2208 length:1134 start_codon:yes stop_codon:yes gene_type:complete
MRRADQRARPKRSGAYSGWPQYRYGESKAYVHKLIFKGDRRDQLISGVLEQLRHFRLSPFENEGPCRHGLRRAIISKGHGWTPADAEAALLVAEGLQRMGAVRPSYDEGQWVYSVSPDYCCSCHGPIDPADQARGFRFCSAGCAGRAYERRAYGELARGYDIARNAYLIIRTDAAPERECKYCGVSFKRWSNGLPSTEKDGSGKFCSKECGDASRRTLTEKACRQCGESFRPSDSRKIYCSQACATESMKKGPNRTCMECGTAFRWRYAGTVPDGGKYCSPACRGKGVIKREVPRVCEWCYSPYTARLENSRFCSPYCGSLSAKVRGGRPIPKTINAPIFDHVFAKPMIDTSTPVLTPRNLDWLFMESGLRITCEAV